MAGYKWKIQEVNAGSMADISFLLLIFFLVATTMNTDSGLARMLPPMPDENTEQKPSDIKERNLMKVFISQNNNIMVSTQEAENQVIDIRQLKEKAKEFVLNPFDLETLPEKKVKEIELEDGSKWSYPVSEGVISLQNDRGTSYEAYIMVQNELTRAFNEVRNELAKSKYGIEFTDLGEAARKSITDAVPLKISEAEPRNVGGK
jgi:biopolymer transport protein ExbD